MSEKVLIHKQSSEKYIDEDENGVKVRKTTLWKKISYQFGVISSAMAFIIAVVSMSMTLTVQEVKKPKIMPPWVTPFVMNYTFSEEDHVYPIGTVVSMNKQGNLQLGGGFTLHRNVYMDHHVQANYLRVAYIGTNILVSAYNSYIRVFILNDDMTIRKEKEVSLPSGRNPDDLITIRPNVLLLLGGNCVLPITVDIDNNENIKVIFGEEGQYFDQFNFVSYFTPLDDTCVAISYLGVNNHLTAAIGCLEPMEGKKQFKINILLKKEYTEDFIFKGISSFNSHKFILSYVNTPGVLPVDSKNNRDSMDYTYTNENTSNNTLFFVIGTYENNQLSFSNPIEYINKGEYGTFEFTKMNDHTVIMVYLNTYKQSSNPTATSLLSVMIFYSYIYDTISFSSNYPLYKYREGGVGTEENAYKHLSIYMLSNTTFGVFYSNALLGESMCFIYIHISPLNTIIPSTEQYILSTPNPDEKNNVFWSSIYRVDDSRFYLMYSLTSNKVPTFAIHIGNFLPTPLGVVITSEKKTVSIASSGVINLPQYSPSLIVGCYYYTNSLGELIQGEYIGSGEIEGINMYIENKNQIMSKVNRVGIAIAEHTLFIQKNSDASAV
ncbi:hypothetical protein WA158_003747 [Blastocystis sp. Blastoise]